MQMLKTMKIFVQFTTVYWKKLAGSEEEDEVLALFNFSLLLTKIRSEIST